jgi:hypothetical protein
VCERDYAFEELLSRVRGEYLEMPGLRLTVSQASRLWGLNAVVSDALLSCLEASGFLRRSAEGIFALANGEGAATRVLPRRSVTGENGHSRMAGASFPKDERLS